MHTTKTDPRSPRKKAADARYAALPPVRILKPLRFIAARCPGTTTTDPVTGMQTYRPSATYSWAEHTARRGQGGLVQSLARSVFLES